MVDLSKLPVTVSLVNLPFSQTLERFDYVGDGVFKLRIPKQYNYQQGWLKVGGLFYGEVILSNKLRIDIDGAQVKPKSKYKTTGVLFSGPDGNLCRLANEFISFRRQEQLDLSRRFSDATRSDFEIEELTERMRTLRDEAAQIARDFDPVYYEEWGKQEIEGNYLSKLFMALLRSKINKSKPFDELPFKEELDRFEPLAATNNQINVIRYTGMHLAKQYPYKPIGTDTRCEIVLRSSELPWNAEAKQANSELLDLIHAFNKQDPINSERFNTLLQLSISEGLAQGKLVPALLPKPDLKQILELPVFELYQISRLPNTPDALTVVAGILKEQIEHPKYVEFLAYLEANALREGQANADKLQEIKQSPATPISLNKNQDIQLLEFPDLEGEELYDKIRASFPGQSLVFDFWGPWCPPCMSDLPHDKILHEKLEGQPITFVYFGCRTPRKIWEDTIIQHEIKGIHILLTASQNVDLMKRFGGTGYPTLRFVDKDGIEHRNAIQRYATANPKLLIRLANK